MLRQRRQVAAIPRVANDAAEDVAVAPALGERLNKFALVEQKTLVGNAGIDQLLVAFLHGVERIAYGEDHSLAGTHTTVNALACPIAIGNVEDGAHVSGGCAF